VDAKSPKEFCTQDGDRTKMANQRVYPCLILKLSLIYNSTDASPVGDPDFHNWGKLAANIRPQTILTMEAT